MNILIEDVKSTYSECLEILTNKNADYAGNEDPFKNFKNSEFIGVSPQKAVLVRLMDKMARISNLLDNEPRVKDEKIDDTIKDAINYLAILKSMNKNKI